MFDFLNVFGESGFEVLESVEAIATTAPKMEELSPQGFILAMCMLFDEYALATDNDSPSLACTVAGLVCEVNASLAG